MKTQPTMLYRLGSMISCGPHNLDYVIVDSDNVAAFVGKGWYKTPDEAAEAGQKLQDEKDLEEQARLDEEERTRVALLQQQIADNEKELAKNPDYIPADGEKTEATPTEETQPAPEPTPAPEEGKAANDKATENDTTARPARRGNAKKEAKE